MITGNVMYEAATLNAQSCTATCSAKIKGQIFYLGTFCGNTLMDIFMQTLFELCIFTLLSSEIKDSTDLYVATTENQQLLMRFYIFWSMYISSLLLRELKLLSFAAVIMYDHTF